MAKPKKILIACEVRDSLPLKSLEPFQGKLKSLSTENYKKLRNEIVETGFAFPVHVWKSAKRNYIVGGHQRVLTLGKLREEGFDIPEVPVIFVKADSIDEAKRRILQDVSQFGRVEGQGLYEFMHESGFDYSSLSKGFDIPRIDIEAFGAEYFFDETEKDDKAEGQSKDNHQCPKCGFRSAKSK